MNTNPLKNLLILTVTALMLTGCGGAADIAGDAPPELPDTLKIKRTSKTYVITGFGSRGDITAAIINDMVVVPGMEIDPGVVLTEVHPTYAVIRYDGTEYQIRPESIQNELDEKQ